MNNRKQRNARGKRTRAEFTQTITEPKDRVIKHRGIDITIPAGTKTQIRHSALKSFNYGS